MALISMIQYHLIFILLFIFLLVSKDIKGLALITGTTSGVGLNTLKPLIRFGWEVIAVNRSIKRAISIAEEFLTKEEFKNVHFIEMDLSNLDDVREDLLP